MSFPIRPNIHVTRGGIRSSNGTRGGTYTGGLSNGDDSDIKVIVPLSLFNKLRSALREEQAESARKEEQIADLHAILRTNQQLDQPLPPNDNVSMENRCLRTLLDLMRASVDFYYKRSGELEKVLIPLLDPDSQRWHFPYADAQNYVVECVEGLTYVKITSLSPGEFLDVVLPQSDSSIVHS